MGAGGSNSVTSIYSPDEKHLQRQLETPNGADGKGWTPLSVDLVPVQKHLALRRTDKLGEKKQLSRPNFISARLSDFKYCFINRTTSAFTPT